MELTKVNNRYWIDGKEVDSETYKDALSEMDSKLIHFLESDFTPSIDEHKEDDAEDLEQHCEESEDEICPLVESLLNENEELAKENEALRNALEEYENSDFDVELAFNQLYDRLDKIEFMINHLQIPITYTHQYTPSIPNIDPKFWEVTYNDPKDDEPRALATDPEAPKKRTRKSKNE